jgi:histidinol phosphatase-like enzyme
MESDELIIGDYKHPVRTIWDIEYLQSMLNATNERSLVVFDIDGTLIVPKDPYDRGYLGERVKAHTIEALTFTQKSLESCNDKAERIMLVSRARQLRKFMLVDDALPAMIQDLHKRNVPTIGLTNCLTGSYGCIKSVEDWRVQILKDLGIEFNSSFGSFPKIIFEQLRKLNKVPIFKQGILFTGHACSKGQLLMAFLYYMGIQFGNAICIDDQEDMLASECSALRTMNIPCVLVRYMASYSMSHKFDRHIAEYQLQYLIDNDRWLTGAQVQTLFDEWQHTQCCCLMQ